MFLSQPHSFSLAVTEASGVTLGDTWRCFYWEDVAARCFSSLSPYPVWMPPQAADPGWGRLEAWACHPWQEELPRALNSSENWFDVVRQLLFGQMVDTVLEVCSSLPSCEILSPVLGRLALGHQHLPPVMKCSKPIWNPHDYMSLWQGSSRAFPVSLILSSVSRLKNRHKIKSEAVLLPREKQ